jgi:nicotinamide-nucleotide amidase
MRIAVVSDRPMEELQPRTGEWPIVNIELINTGTELLLGSIINTNQQWLCYELARRGYLITRQVTVDDSPQAIQEAVREAIGRAQLVITTGGLGPTSDDRTRECVAELFGRGLHEDTEVLDRIVRFFQTRNRPMPARTRLQALVPEGALVLPNNNGTAPGLALEFARGKQEPGSAGLFIMLPGPPRELEPMFLDQVVPLLEKRFPQPLPFACRILKSTGVGESAVEEKIATPLAALISAGLEIGYCARFGEVDVRLVARGANATRVVAEAEQTVRTLLGKHIFGSDAEQLHAVIVRALTERQQTVTLAESCTGGYIANRLTNVPGASAVFLGGFVTYSNDAKQSCLGVRAETLATHGAVSEPVAREMAEGAMGRLKSDYALAVTGIAGPGGGTPDKPVGTVYIALAGGGPTVVLRQLNRYDRESFKFVTSQQALETLRRRLLH